MESQYGQGSGMNATSPFLSTTDRGDFWKNELNAPYTKQTYLENPGPGQYDAKGKKKENEVKNRILWEHSMQMHVPFNTSDERGCNKKTKTAAPGPGTYIDINNPNNSSICKSLNKIKEDRTLAESQGVKLGAFGTTTGRFTKSWMNPKEGPGPGFYEEETNGGDTNVSDNMSIKGRTLSRARTLSTAEAEKRMPNMTFRSNVDRFELCYSAAAPNVRILK